MGFIDTLNAQHKTKGDLERERQEKRCSMFLGQKDTIIENFKQSCLGQTRKGKKEIYYEVSAMPEYDRDGDLYWSSHICDGDIKSARVLCEELKVALSLEGFKKLSVSIEHPLVPKSDIKNGFFNRDIKFYKYSEKAQHKAIIIKAKW